MALIWYILIRLFDLTLFRWITDGLSSLELGVGERLQEFAGLGDDPGIVPVLDGVQLLVYGHPVDDMALCFQGLGYDPGECRRGMLADELKLVAADFDHGRGKCRIHLLCFFVIIVCYCVLLLQIYTRFAYNSKYLYAICL